MAGFNYVFDATQFQPSQSAGAHPIGKYPAVISHTEIKPTSKGDGGMFVVTFQSQAGKIDKRYNLFNNSQQAVEIAQKEMSALCHAVGVFKVDMNNEGASLRGGRCIIDVQQQVSKPEYVEVREIADMNGNVPGGKGAPAAQQQPGQPQPGLQPGPAFNQASQQPQGGFGGQPPAGPSNWQAQSNQGQHNAGFQAQAGAAQAGAAQQPDFQAGNPNWQAQQQQPQTQPQGGAPAWSGGPAGQQTGQQPQGQPAGQGAPSWSQNPGGAAPQGGQPSWAR